MIARASVLVASSSRIVWDVLLRPDTIPRMLPVSEVVLPWKRGQPFHWKLDMLGKPVDVRGTVLRVDDERHVLEYEFVDPLAAKNRHRVTIAITDDAAGARVDVEQDENLTPQAHAHAEGGWRLALHHLKAIVEDASRPHAATRDH